MKKLLSLFLILILVCGCNKSDDTSGSDNPDPDTPTGEVIPAPGKGERSSQTTIMYFTGTSLKGFFDRNVIAASKAIGKGALGDGRFLVFWLKNYSEGELFEVYRSSTSGETKNLLIDNFDGYAGFSLTEDAIVKVIAKAKEYAPSDTYNIIISGHGTGWVTQEHPYLKSIMSDYVDWDAMCREGSHKVTRFLGHSQDGYMEIEELNKALEETQTHFGYVLFDACLMSNIETQYDLKDRCDYIIASPCEIMGDGFPYETVLPELFEDNGKSVDYEGVCQAYYDYYLNNIDPNGCIAVCDTKELTELAKIVKLINNNTPNSVSVNDLQPYERLSDHVFLDFEQYILAICSDDDLKAKFVSQFNKAYPIECRFHTDKFYSNLPYPGDEVDIDYYSGVTTSAPSVKFRDDWNTTQWVRYTRK